MDKKLVYLHPEGVDLRKYKFPEKFIAIIGDHKGLPKQTEKLLDRLNAERISLGKVEYLASHCIVILHNELDRRF
jgi:tRNA (pseudouridine54-N1)-methyltransferase